MFCVLGVVLQTVLDVYIYIYIYIHIYTHTQCISENPMGDDMRIIQGTNQCKWRLRYYVCATNQLRMLRIIRLAENAIGVFTISLYIHDIRSLAYNP